MVIKVGKKLFTSLIFCLIVLVGALIFVLAQTSYSRSFDSSTYEVTIEIGEDGTEGWYLVPGNVNDAECKDNILAYWIWSPTANKWIGGRSFDKISESDINIFFNDEKNNYLYAKTEFSGIFVYLKKPCKLVGSYTNYGGSSRFWEDFNGVKLAKGWNFFGIDPGYDGVNFDSIKGTCNIIKAADWNPSFQKWELYEPSEVLPNIFYKIDAGHVVLVKVSEECSLSLKIPSPELELPGIPK